MFITQADFNLIPYAIANRNENGETINTLIPAIEKKILVDTLGLVLYNEFVLGIEALPDVWADDVDYVVDDEVYQGVTIWQALQPNTNVVPVEGADWTKVEDNIWLKLRDGFVYEYQDKAYEYEGVKSFLVPLFYFHWLKDFVFDTQTDAGIVASDLENAGNNGPNLRMVRAWNDGANKIGSKVLFKNSLWGFLYGTWETDYPNLDFGELKKINEFDL